MNVINIDFVSRYQPIKRSLVSDLDPSDGAVEVIE